MNFCVYKHTSPSGKVYIGITSQNPLRRWGSNGINYKHNKYFYRAILKYGWDNFTHEILCEGLSKEEAEAKEIALIAEHKSNNPEHGYNIQSGGNYAGKHSEATRRKFSEVFKGRIPDKKARENMSKAHIVRQVVQMDDDGNILAVWNGYSTAGKALGIPYQNIAECLKENSRRKHAGGYVWRYLDEVRVVI